MKENAKKLNVPPVSGFEDADSFAGGAIECINWPDSFPYRPQVNFKAGHSAEKLFIRFEVKETNARAVCLESNGPVWEDSCVEFFVRIPGDTHYFNFETNCIGTGLAARRLSREECTHFTAEQMNAITRISSLPHEITDKDECEWTLDLIIPFSALGCKSCPETLEANFYKCGDRTRIPHFISWSPVQTPSPDFHRPEFFGTLFLLQN